jgi:four helix bundle protein
MSLADRTRDFSIRVIRLCSALPRNDAASVIRAQLLRSATSPGAHFREAIRGRSRVEFIAKLNNGLMELEETLYWLELIKASNFFPSSRVEPLMQETNELIAIFASLINRQRSKPKTRAATHRR